MGSGSAVIRTPDQRLRVFVSSTLQELEPERVAAAEAIRGLKLTPVLFELGARPHPPRQLYRAYLEQSHVFVGIYGERYGWVAPGMEISGLDDEYRLSGDRPKLLYVKRPAPAREARLEGLLRRIEEHDRACYKTFSTPEELGAMLSNDLAVLLSERFEASPRVGGRPRSTRRTLSVAAAAAVVVVAASLVSVQLYRQRGGGPAAAETGAEVASVAVLPFVNMSPDPDQEYFSDGLSEELLNALTKIPDLKVTGRTSSFSFKGRNEDLRVIGKQLGVASILEGSVRKSGDRIRITAQLVKAEDGFHLWSETYDRTLGDIFGVQDDIARNVVQALRPALAEASAPTSGVPKELQVYTLVLQGRYFSDRRTREDSEKAVDCLERALRIDPDYAPAWAELSRAYATQAGSGFAPVDESIARAREAADKALAIDPNCVTAHAMLGWVALSRDWDWAEARAHLGRALELDPGGVGVLSNAAMLERTLGRFDESVRLYERAVSRDPLQGLAYAGLGISLLYAGRLDEAEAAVRKSIALRPEAFGQHYLLGRVLLAKARFEEAREAFEREPDEGWRLTGEALVYRALGRDGEADAALQALSSTYADDMPYQIAQVLAYRGETDRALAWLDRALTLHDTGLSEIVGDPLMKSLEPDPRHAAFIAKLGLPGSS